MDPTVVAARRRRLTIRRFASAAEADRHDLEFWLAIPPGERVLEAWRLSEEQWRLRGDYPDEPRFPRPAAVLRRR